MRALAEVAGQDLLWLQPRMLQRAHELRAGDEVVAAAVIAGS